MAIKENDLARQFENLKVLLQDMGSVAIAYSAGVDSTFLLKVAHDVLGDKAVAITVKSRVVPGREIQDAIDFCKTQNIRHEIIDFDEMSVEGFRENPKERCYVCKRAIFSRIKEVARGLGLQQVCEGSNVDDLVDYRPGLKAIAELDIKSPLREAGLTKAGIRELSQMLNLPTWNKPSFACLASRIPYGEQITEEKLRLVERAEQFLQNAGFKQFRVRCHGSNFARIEILPDDIQKLIEIRNIVVSTFKEIGFTYVSLDLQGYRTGSLNVFNKK